MSASALPQLPGVIVDMKTLSHPWFTYDFSIWYCPDDDDVASRISETLMEHGFRGYVEHQDQVAGTSVALKATEVIEASQVAIIILSARSLHDPWCQRVLEWNLQHVIEREGTKMIPVYVDVKKHQVPLVLRHLNELDYRSAFFQQKLLDGLQRAKASSGKARTAVPSKVSKAKSSVGL
ncbi:UPF0449 protein C19orf25 homolog isoform X1 [Alligator mississippiensis]|uniref:UPF0449 protein C19orf25 homolog isoform X1 n=1 Tax=Alligator mississippiensis TaxID=8496 RepID=UPI002877F6FC|nr:UPF0449 protein C19orf25 homolog isoform X1 [Alligator mississippiensis]